MSPSRCRWPHGRRSRKTEQSFAFIFRFIITPLFLFSGTFFPIEQLPDALEWVAWLTPLFHGVALTRALGHRP